MLVVRIILAFVEVAQLNVFAAPCTNLDQLYTPSSKPSNEASA